MILKSCLKLMFRIILNVFSCLLCNYNFIFNLKLKIEINFNKKYTNAAQKNNRRNI